MENYDERMNYSFEPADESAQFHAENQAPKQEPSENKPKHSKKTTAKLVALVLVVALLGSVGGSVLTSVIGNIQNKNTAAVATMEDVIIDMRGIVKRFYIGTPNELEILHGIDLTVRRGEFVSIVGASGSGKSTLMPQRFFWQPVQTVWGKCAAGA